MMNLPKSSASSPTRSQPMKPSTSLVSDQLTPSEIDSLRQSKKLIAAYVQRELPERLKQHQLAYVLNKA